MAEIKTSEIRGEEAVGDKLGVHPEIIHCLWTKEKFDKFRKVGKDFGISAVALAGENGRYEEVYIDPDTGSVGRETKIVPRGMVWVAFCVSRSQKDILPFLKEEEKIQ